MCVFVSSAGNAEIPAPASGRKQTPGRTDPNSDHEEGKTAALERSTLRAFYPHEHHGHHCLLSSIPQQHSHRSDTRAASAFCLSFTFTVLTRHSNIHTYALDNLSVSNPDPKNPRSSSSHIHTPLTHKPTFWLTP